MNRNYSIIWYATRRGYNPALQTLTDMMALAKEWGDEGNMIFIPRGARFDNIEVN